MDRLLLRIAVSMATLMLVAVAVFVAAFFLGGAAYLALRAVLTPLASALATGVGALVLAIVIGLSGRAVSRCHRRRPRPSAGDGTEDSRLAGLLGKELAGLIRRHGRASVLGSLIAGFAVGASPGLRRFLRDLLKD